MFPLAVAETCRSEYAILSFLGGATEVKLPRFCGQYTVWDSGSFLEPPFCGSSVWDSGSFFEEVYG